MIHTEKRLSERCLFKEEDRYLVEYKTHGRLFQKQEVALTMDVSNSGLLFRTSRFIPVNTTLSINLSLPNQKPVHTLARVVRAEISLRQGMFDIAIHYLQKTSIQPLSLVKQNAN